MSSPRETLAVAYAQAAQAGAAPLVDAAFIDDIDYICRSRNRSGVRVLLACTLAKIDEPTIDIRKPYTEISADDTFSGRYYDEQYITAFISQHDLPCNRTTAFLTPAWRNRNQTLTVDLEIEGRPKKLYRLVLKLLHAVYEQTLTADSLLREAIRQLILIREENDQRIATLLADLAATDDDIPLSSEAIIRILAQHLDQPRASRLPVLVFAAAYQTMGAAFNERVLPFAAHNAADSQTQAIGDLEIALATDDNIVTSYEMKTRKVTVEDVNHALQKVVQSAHPLDNYIFITTEPIEDEVSEYAASLYEDTGGIEFVVLDCVSFVRHFVHFFHRHRINFLDVYQSLVLAEPESAVSQPLKEVLLTLRRANEM